MYLAQVRSWENYDGSGTSCLVDGIPTLKCAEVVVSNLLFMASIFVVLILFIMLVVGGVKHLTAFGDANKVKSAQGTLKWAVIGVVLYMVSFLILRIIDVLFLGGTGTLFNFTIPQ